MKFKCEECDIDLELSWNKLVGYYFYCSKCGDSITANQLPTDGKEYLKGIIKLEENGS